MSGDGEEGGIACSAPVFPAGPGGCLHSFAAGAPLPFMTNTLGVNGTGGEYLLQHGGDAVLPQNSPRLASPRHYSPQHSPGSPGGLHRVATTPVRPAPLQPDLQRDSDEEGSSWSASSGLPLAAEDAESARSGSAVSARSSNSRLLASTNAGESVQTANAASCPDAAAVPLNASARRLGVMHSPCPSAEQDLSVSEGASRNSPPAPQAPPRRDTQRRETRLGFSRSSVEAQHVVTGHGRDRKGQMLWLPGEVTNRSFDCRLLVPSAGDFVPAVLYFTNYRIGFRVTSRKQEGDRARGGGARVFSIPHTTIARVRQRSRHVLKQMMREKEAEDVPAAAPPSAGQQRRPPTPPLLRSPPASGRLASWPDGALQSPQTGKQPRSRSSTPLPSPSARTPAASPHLREFATPDEDNASPAMKDKGKGEKLDFFEVQTKGISCYLVHVPVHEEAVAFARLLQQLLPCMDGKEADLFCFRHHGSYMQARERGRPTAVVQTPQQQAAPPIGHESLAVAEEFRRWLSTGSGMLREDVTPSWRLTHVNQNFKTCASYPELCVVPRAAEDALIEASAQFRTKGRFPVCAWLHREHGAALCRSSQPKVGLMQSRRSAEDELLVALLWHTPAALKADSIPSPTESVDALDPPAWGFDERRRARSAAAVIGPPTTSPTPDDTPPVELRRRFVIFDCRPFANAVANRPMGGGYEHPRNYSGASYENLQLVNIHEVSSALRSVRKVSVAPPRGTGNWMAAMVNSGWLKHIERLIVASIRVAAEVASGTSCLVHCSDGWDRTTQVVSLAKLLLDPYYRTIRGFQVLLQTDWLAHGHKMADRHGNVEGCQDQAESSPIFLQWMDSVWQVWRHFRVHFEFTEEYLIYILDHSTSGRFGNFMGNNERERREMKLAQRTVSLWDHINSPEEMFMRPEFANALYVPDAATSILPQSWPRQLLWWEAYHSRLDYEWTDIGDTTSRQILQLGRQVEALRVQLRRMADLVDRRPSRRGDTVQRLISRMQIVESDRGAYATVRWLLEDCVLQPVYDYIERKDSHDRHRSASQASAAAGSNSGRRRAQEDSCRWVPDDLAPCCRGCLRPFNVFRRKHHCRHCGNVFCDRCSAHRAVVPGGSPHKGPVRVCDACRARLKDGGSRSGSGS